jgi:tRNA dimethylallyltransferase
LWIGLDFQDRSQLYRRIDLRVELMLKAGLVEEIRSLLASGIPAKCTAMQAIGYKEFVAALDGQCTIDQAADEVRKGSRHYAKRQLTWFRRNKNMIWLRRKPTDGTAEILRLARHHLFAFDN